MLPMDDCSHSSVRFDPRSRGLDSYDVNRLLNQGPDFEDDFEFPRDYTTSTSCNMTLISKIHGMESIHQSLSPSITSFNDIDLDPRHSRPLTEQHPTIDSFSQNIPIKMEAEMTQDGHCLVLPMSDEAAQRSIGSSSESHTDSMHESPRGKVLQSRSRMKRRPYTRAEIEAQRAVANNRERQRTLSLNEAFSALRGILPTAPSDKMSKFNTLKIAVSYISFLTSMLEQEQENSKGRMYDHEGNPKARNNLSYAFSVWRMEGTLKSAPHSLGSSEQQGFQDLQHDGRQYPGQDEEARWDALAKRYPD